MLAPRRVPPCLMVSVAASKTLMKESGPLETPLVLSTTSLCGRRREKEKPVPPPLLWMRAVFLMASKMDSMESPDGQHEAGGELAELAAGVHEGGGVGQELEARHELVEGLLPLLDRGGGVVEALGLGDGARDAPEHLLGGLEHLAVLALLEVAALQHLERVGRQLDHCLPRVSHAPFSPE